MIRNSKSQNFIGWKPMLTYLLTRTSTSSPFPAFSQCLQLLGLELGLSLGFWWHYHRSAHSCSTEEVLVVVGFGLGLG